jgi:hypothetical protein
MPGHHTVNQPGASSYPISGYSWVLVYTRQTNQATGQVLAAMLNWLTHDRWLDGGVALGLAAWAVIEGRRAWVGTTCGCATCQ